jgi:hypothetical protein
VSVFELVPFIEIILFAVKNQLHVSTLSGQGKV